MLTPISTDGVNGSTPTGLWLPATYVGGAGSCTVQNNAIQISTAAVGSFGGAARLVGTLPFYRAFEMYVRILPGQPWSNDAFLSFGLADAGGAANQPLNGWTLDIGNSPSSNPAINQEIAGAATALITSAFYTFTSSNAIWVRFRKVGLNVMVKMWDDVGAGRSAEPLTWTAIGALATGPLTPTKLFSYFGVNTGAGTTARTFTIDKITFDDLAAVAVTPPPQAVAPSAPVSSGFFTTGVAA